MRSPLTFLPALSFSDSPMTPDYAWAHREGRNARYDNKRVGGTVCVHFIKKNMWFLETVFTFLEMQDATELEMHPSEPDEEQSEFVAPPTGSSSGHRENPDSVPEDKEPDMVDPDTKEEHGLPIRPIKDMHVLLVQGGAKRLPIDIEGTEGRGDGPVVPPLSELEWSEGAQRDDRKRGVDSGVRGEGENERTIILPPAGHFSNGSRRITNR